MGKADRKRWDGNVKSMAIIAKPDDEIICPVLGREYSTWIDDCELWQDDILREVTNGTR